MSLITSPASETRTCPMCGTALANVSPRCARCGEPVVQRRPPPRFRWRIIPTFSLGLTAGIFLLGALSQLVPAFIFVLRGGSASVVVREALLGIAAILPAAAWGTAARFWWRGRWRWAVACTVVGYLAAHIGPWLAGRL